jgi:dolichyl-diphosphooligosaccharide--protein glycosyltransferase
LISLTKEGFAVKSRNLLSKDGAVDALKSIGAIRFKMSHSSALHISLLAIILVIAAVIRLLPLRWGFQLSEFDPHIHYRLTKHMVDNGFFAWTSWTDTMSWYPQGYNISGAIFPGLAATAAFFYQIANALNLAPAPILSSTVYHPLTADPVFNFCVLFPVFMAVVTVLVIYFVGKDIGGKEVGLFSAFFLALSSSFISRTSLGFFDDENVGIFGILLFIFFFLRSIDKDKSIKSTVTYAVAGGISLGYLFSSWGAARYPLGITLVFVLVMILLKRYSTRLLISYGTTFAVALGLAACVPKLGLSFLTEPTVLAVAGMFLVLCMIEASRRITTPKSKMYFVIGFLAVLVVGFVALDALGVVGNLEAKFVSVIFPSERMGEGVVQQLVQSVQEHKPATWGSFYYDLGIGLLFVPIGLYFTLQNPTNRNIFLAIFGVTAIYFAGSMVRLTLLMAPACSLLWALALVQLIKPFATILRDQPTMTSRRKMRFKPRVGKEFSAIFIILMFLLLTVTFVLPSTGAKQPRVISRAYSPTTIAASSLPMRTQVSDWLDTLNWIRVNLNEDDVVAAWWDYGYWLTAIGNTTTLADNGTVNSTQISTIGQMFMSNETEALKILKSLEEQGDKNITHVVVFQTFATNDEGTTLYDYGYGDESKWRWMARIGGLDDNLYGNYTSLGTDWVDTNEDGQADEDELIVNELGNSTVIYKLMHYARDILTKGQSDIVLEHFERAYFSQEDYSTLDWYQESSDTYFATVVCVYKINYD